MCHSAQTYNQGCTDVGVGASRPLVGQMIKTTPSQWQVLRHTPGYYKRILVENIDFSIMFQLEWCCFGQLEIIEHAAVPCSFGMA